MSFQLKTSGSNNMVKEHKLLDYREQPLSIALQNINSELEKIYSGDTLEVYLDYNILVDNLSNWINRRERAQVILIEQIIDSDVFWRLFIKKVY